jgi:hypothetical protein
MGCLEKSWSNSQLLVDFGNHYGVVNEHQGTWRSKTHLSSNHSLMAAALAGPPHSIYAILRAYKLSVRKGLDRESIPFTFAIDLVFRECDVFMINGYANAKGYLAQILVRCPLKVI